MPDDEQLLDSPHALVCGASAGIGRAAAQALASIGSRVAVLARSSEALDELVPELLARGAPEAHAVVADLDDRDAADDAVADLIARHGAVHILVNNTGGPPAGPLLDADDDAFLTAFGRHVLASHRLVRRVLPGMRESRYGRIVNVISTSVREPIPGLGVSNTIRGAMAGWAKTLSRELPRMVTINNVLPGFTDTERLGALAESLAADQGRSVQDVHDEWVASVPAGRIGRPDEIGAVIAFLASPAASYVNGVSLPVDGGRLQSI